MHAKMDSAFFLYCGYGAKNWRIVIMEAGLEVPMRARTTRA
jgi:hypothetical protein